MKPVSGLSIRQKLTRIVLASCGSAILVASIVFMQFDNRSTRSALTAEITTLARMTGSNVTAALEFGDAKSAAETLGSLVVQPHVMEACVYTPDGKIFAKYARDANRDFQPPAPRPDGTQIRTADSIELFQTITLNGEKEGTIYLRADVGEITQHAHQFMGITAFVVFLSLITAYLLASRLQRSISEPILNLAKTAFAISLGNDYSVRVEQKSDDEVGFLVERFNDMMNRIQVRETALQEAQSQLEARVEERTRELKNEIAEREQAEDALEEKTHFLNSLIENSPIAIVGATTDHCVRMVNRAYEEIFLKSAKDIVGRQIIDLPGTPEGVEEAKANRELVVQGKTVHTLTRRKRGDGTFIDVELHIVPIMSQGKYSGSLALYQDVTQRKQAEQHLLRAKEAAEAANQAKSDFLANMSHEIRTPMNGIIGMTELALDTDLTTEQREYLTLVKTSADSLLALISDILDFSKIEAGKLDIDIAEFSFAQSLGETLKALGYRAHQKGLELAWRVGQNVPSRLMGDVSRLRQVIVNLVGNSLKFTHQGEVVVEADKESEDETGMTLHFQVRDTGIGIPLEKQRLIFEAFTQADTSTTRQYGGTGLGLAITERLVKLMGGRIWVESEPGFGSAFHFTAHFGHAAENSTLESTAGPEILQECPVLIIDDNRTNRIILVEMLSSWHMKPEAVESAAAALEVLDRHRREGRDVRLIVTDMQMPEMDGLSLLDKLRKEPAFAKLPVILLSSSVQHGETSRSRSLGCSAYLTKPVQPSELFDAMVAALSSKSVAETSVRPAPQTQQRRKIATKILLAEDNAVNRKLAKTLLEKHGYTVVIATNGREAIDILGRDKVDLVLMDVQMPEMDGLEATRTLRETEHQTGKHLHIIALTAHAMKGDRERCLEAGADDYLTKPIRTTELLAAIDRAQENAMKQADESTDKQVGETRAEQSADADVLDVASALDRVEGDRELLGELVALFSEETAQSAREIRAAFNAGDSKLLERLAHTVKGAASNIGAVAVSGAARALEEHARATGVQDAHGKIVALEAEMERLQPALEAVVGKTPHGTPS